MLSVFSTYLKGQNMRERLRHSSKTSGVFSNRSCGEAVVAVRQVRWTDKKSLFQAGDGEVDVTLISDDRWDAEMRRVTLEQTRVRGD